ncbi:phasin family protein [Methylobacterium mesophilicum]
MHHGRTHHQDAQVPVGPSESLAAGLATWRALAVDLPLRLAAETMRFTGRRIQARADHLAALAACGSFKDAVALQAAFLTTGVSDYQQEATTLSQDVTETAFAKAA